MNRFLSILPVKGQELLSQIITCGTGERMARVVWRTNSLVFSVAWGLTKDPQEDVRGSRQPPA